MADHNDPNAVNSIFSDIEVSAADVYDMFGYPSDAPASEERVVIALTFAAVPQAGVFDSDMLYRLQISAHPRVAWPADQEPGLNSVLRYFEGIKDKYLVGLRAAEVRVRVDQSQQVHVDFRNFPGGTMTRIVPTNTVVSLDGIQAFFGGRDDAFFNDLPGFFRSINYAPQFYHVPHDRPDLRELPIPKTLIELEGNTLFNYDPGNPQWGRGVKKDLPDGPLTWTGDRFSKDANGNFRFVYSGQDAQAGKNVNAIVLEMPLSFLTAAPSTDRIVDVWGESWVRKASGKVATLQERPLAVLDALRLDDELKQYKLVDTVGQPFADAALAEREDSRQVGANNFLLAPHFITRLAHLGWGFGPSITALGLQTSFDHDNSPISVHRTYALATQAFPRVKKTLVQALNMPDLSWNKEGLPIPLRRPFEIFVPNVCAIDMDTTGTWPFGRRLEDQVASRFLALFLDMDAELNGRKYHLEMLNDQALWDQVPIEPKTPPNPLKNDKEFLREFPYLAEPWPADYHA